MSQIRSGDQDVTTEPPVSSSPSHETTTTSASTTAHTTQKSTSPPVVTSDSKSVTSTALTQTSTPTSLRSTTGTSNSTVSTGSSSTLHLQTTPPPSAMAITTTTSTTTTTQASFPWKGVSMGMMGGVGLLLLVCILLIVAICKLKRRLKKAHVTLYPVARDAEHAYTPLAPAVKKGLAVEMSKVTSADVIEEVDSPTFSSSPPPPTFPRPASTSQSSTSDKPPAVPARRVRKPRNSASETSMKSREKGKWQTSSDSRTSSTTTGETSGVDNMAFGGEVVHHGSIDGDDIYERYDVSLYKNVKVSGGGDADTSSANTLDSAMAYEVPVTMRNKQKSSSDSEFIRRQSSTSGLPEAVFRLSEINETKNNDAAANVPEYLDLSADDEVDSKDTGLPTGDGPLDIDDLQTYEDVEDEISPTDKVRNASQGSGSNENKEPEHTFRIIEPDPNFNDQPSPLYDTGLMGDKRDSDDNSEPGLYEDLDYDIDGQNIAQITSNDQVGEEEIKKPSRDMDSQVETMDEYNVVENGVATDPLNLNNGIGSIDTKTEPSLSRPEAPSMTEPILVPPIVPPRRDLGQTPPSLSLDLLEPPATFEQEDSDGAIQSPLVPLGDGEIRPGKRVSGITNTLDEQNSYFLDMEDSFKEINEAHQERITVHKMDDSEMSLSELLHLYEGEKTHEYNAMGDTPELSIEANMPQLVNPDISTDKVVPSQVSNGILANGNVPDNAICTTDYFEFEENVYDVPPPRQDESLA